MDLHLLAELVIIQTLKHTNPVAVSIKSGNPTCQKSKREAVAPEVNSCTFMPKKLVNKLIGAVTPVTVAITMPSFAKRSARSLPRSRREVMRVA